MQRALPRVPAAFIRSMLLAYDRYGQDPSRALAAAQLDLSGVNMPHARVTARQMEVFTEHAMRELDDESLGWFSRRLRFGTAGMLCRAALPSANLRVALLRWCRNYGYVQDDIRLHLRQEERITRLEIHELSDLGSQREFCLVSTFRNVLGFACWLVDSQLPLLEVAFSYRPPPHAKSYAHIFGREARFSQPSTSLSFNSEYLALPVRRSDAELRQMLTRPLPLVVRQYRHDRLLSRRVRLLLQRTPTIGNAAEVARQLHISTRTLYRQLSAEQTSLQRLKDDVRRDLAVEQMLRTPKTLQQVAAMVGFSGEASFNRAFKQWTGLAPGRFRERASR